MATTLWCRYKDCGIGLASVAGQMQPVCPGCHRPARWTTMQPELPTRAYALNPMDKKFLKALHITSDDPE